MKYTSTKTALFCRKEFLRIAAQSDEIHEKELQGYLAVNAFTKPIHRDYFEIDMNGEIYLMPRSSFQRKGHVFYPINYTIHSKLWRFGKKIDCLNLAVNRSTTDSRRKIALIDVEKLADLRDLFIKYGAIPILMDGTLLGWYRECSIIPHTKDVDIAIFEEDFPFILGETLPSLNLTWLYRDAILGRPDDNYILKLKIYGQTSFIVDIYAMYLDEKENVSFTTAFDSADFAKLKTTYPRLDILCAVDLLNHIFHAPCNTIDYLLVEFGSNWTDDRPSNKYHWRNAPLNTKTYGYFNKSEKFILNLI
ncbi:unnamed protein product, partial [Mesorhabditis belari]|uniref:Fukutin n=1 Tax=Mesorhabditis belari TaxID=2138241 RepID=A0AAF3J4S3_9BILA